MQGRRPDAVYKVVLCGDAGTGKTSILARFAAELKKTGKKSIDLSSIKPTIGVEFESFDMERVVEGKSYYIRVQVWDTAGQERYRAITKSHYRRANGALIVFDLTRSDTFENAKLQWLPELTDTASDVTGLLHSIAIVGNKSDLPAPGALYDDAEAFAKANGYTCFKSSAVSGHGLSLPVETRESESGTNANVFLSLIDQIHKTHLGLEKQQRRDERGNLSANLSAPTPGGGNKNGGCC